MRAAKKEELSNLLPPLDSQTVLIVPETRSTEQQFAKANFSNEHHFLQKF